MNFATAALEARSLRKVFSTIGRMLISNLNFYSKSNYETSEKAEEYDMFRKANLKKCKKSRLRKLLEDTLCIKE